MSRSRDAKNRELKKQRKDKLFWGKMDTKDSFGNTDYTPFNAATGSMLIRKNIYEKR